MVNPYKRYLLDLKLLVIIIILKFLNFFNLNYILKIFNKDFGEIFVKSRVVKTFIVKNDLRNAIKV